MKSMAQKFCALALTALAATAWVSQAQAAPVVSISPASQTINVGDPGSIDILVSGLDDAVGGFSLTLNFLDSILGPDLSFGAGFGYVLDPGATMGALPLDLSGGFSGGSLDLFFVADFAETEASLSAAQGASFTLATVQFTGLANGLSPLTLSGVTLSNWDGTETLPGVSSRNGSICVGGNCTATSVPEPTSVLLVGTALAALALRRRQFKA